MKNKLLIWIGLALILGVLILLPQSNQHNYLSTGDHGRDLYAIAQTAQGAEPYRDYWWVYGPLAPYYYSTFFKTLGGTIHSILIGENLLVLLSGMLIMAIVWRLGNPFAGLAAALWFWLFHDQFFYTYNHTGGITLLMLSFWGLTEYIFKHNKRWLWIALGAAFTLCFIKVNFGLLAWFVLCSSMTAHYMMQPKSNTPWYRQPLLWANILFPFLVLAVYMWTLRGLSLVEIRQCLPYLAEDHPMHLPMLESLKLWFRFMAMELKGEAVKMVLAVIFFGSIIKIIIDKVRNRHPQLNKHLAILSIATVAYVLCLHEILPSGVWYRKFWAQPFGIVMVFGAMAVAFHQLKKSLHILFWCVLMIFLGLKAVEQLQQHHPQYAFLNHPRGQVYISNQPRWTLTVVQTTQFLKERLKNDETFFALPYDPLYYYLTDRPSPTRQLIFFDHINISTEQERDIIDELKAHNTKFVVISNRQHSLEPGMGHFGKTYCPELALYIKNNYTAIQQFGDWVNPPGWGWNHGTVIFQRNPTP